MRASNLLVTASLCLIVAGIVSGEPLPCLKHGTERWPVKITVPAGAKTEKMTLSDALTKLPRLTDVKKDDSRYADKRIEDQSQKEDAMVTISGWLYLVAFEGDDCDFHIQLSTKPRTTTDKPTADDNCMIVEIPSETYATTIAGQVGPARQWVIDNLLAKKDPKINSVHVMVHPVYVTVTGALFYDTAHTYGADGGTGRGKKGMQSKTLWELHPVTKIAFAPKPKT